MKDKKVNQIRTPEHEPVSRFKSLRSAGVLVVAVALLAGNIGYLLGASGPLDDGTVLEHGSLVTGASYIFFEDDGIYKVRKGWTGAINHSDTVFEDAWADMMAQMSSGGLIYVADGEYEKTSVLGLDIRSNVTVQMSQGAKVVLADNVGDSPVIFGLTDRSNVAIKGGVLDGNKDGQTTTAGIAAMGISFTTVTDSLIEGVTIKDIGTAAALSGYGIYLNDASSNRIIGNHIDGCKRENLVLFTNSDFCTVSNNVFQNAEDRHVVVHGSSYSIITDNTLENSGGFAVNLFSDTKHYGIEFSHNIIRNSTDNAIHCSAIDGLRVIDNQIYDCGDYGVYIYNAGDFSQVSYNTIVGCDSVGIRVLADYVQANGNVIEATSTQGATDRGLRIEGDHAVITGNSVNHSVVGINLVGNYGLVDGNQVSECDAANAIGIFVSVGYMNVVSNNVLSENLRGIYVDTTSNGTNIIGNVVYASDQDGIYIDGSDDTLIQGNILSDNGVAAVGGAMNGVAIANGATFATVIGNTAIMGTYQQYAIRAFAGTSGVVIEFNDFVQGGTTAAISDASTDAVIRYNLGWVTEGSGTATITGAVNTVVVTHGLITTPACVEATGNNSGIGDIQITAVSATTFTIWFENQPGASEWMFYWFAQTW